MTDPLPSWEQKDKASSNFLHRITNLAPRKFARVSSSHLTLSSALCSCSRVQAFLHFLCQSLISVLIFSLSYRSLSASPHVIVIPGQLGSRELRKMNGYYSRMRATRSSSHKSRSLDFSDLLHFSSETDNPSTGESRESTRIKGNPGQNAEVDDRGLLDSSLRLGKPVIGGESFRVVQRLSRSCSMASKRFSRRLERQSIGAQCSAVKRAFSMRRSSSVSERYCKIHDQSKMDYEEDDAPDMTGSMKKIKNKKRGGGKIFKACKGFLGF